MHLISILLALAFGASVVEGAGLPTAEAAIVGSFAKGPVDVAIEVDSVAFAAHFGSAGPESYPAEIQARQYFRNGGTSLAVVRIDPRRPLPEALAGSVSPPHPKGLGALLPLSDLGLLICPELTTLGDSEITACLQRIADLGADRPLFTLLDPPSSVTSAAEMIAWRHAHLPANLTHAAIYYPLLSLDPATWSGGTSAVRIPAGASGSMAAVIARNDATRGIWKAPAGNTATLLAEDLSANLSTSQIDALNPAGICALRSIPGSGIIAWGSRSLDGDPENLYIPVNRTRRWIVRSLQRELSDAAIRPNDAGLRSSLAARVQNFLDPLFLQGAFAGASPEEAYFVRCDATTTSAADIADHRANVLLGGAFLRPAELSFDLIALATLDVAKPVPQVPVLFSRALPGTFQLAYPTTPGFNHGLQSSGSMAPGSWFDGGVTPGDGSWRRFEIPATDPMRFFLVESVIGW